MKIQLRTLVVAALFIALTYIFTWINVNLLPWIPGGGGLTHLGNVPLFIAAMLFGKKTGALVGGIGMALFDWTSAYYAWAPATLIINLLIGFIFGLIVENREELKWYFLAVGSAIMIKVIGYYIAEGIIYGNWMAPVASIPANVIQVVVAAIIILPIIGRLRIVAKKFQNG